ncbi:MAG: peptidylprolyl isomerase [Polyangiaceae bacterium]|nr:peptidylprolyl isomerase [Polyangiaceae bacterium]
MFTSYPRGRWRLIPYSELNRILLWPSHILVRHEDSTEAITPFSELPAWAALEPPPSRTRDEALKLAQQIAAKARQAPGEFAKLAGKYSEDTETRHRGGSLGGIVAGSWGARWPQVVDALAATNPGQVSDVVETEFGFHVLLRRVPPEPAQVAARRIVIGHDRAPFLASLRSGAPLQRPRAEALALATHIAEQARKAPNEFVRLVARHSEGPDGEQNGDIGVWSLRERSVMTRELEAVAASQIGEVVGPMDSAIGFQVLLRTLPEARKKYAATLVKLPFDPEAPADTELSKGAVQARAKEMIEALAKHPDRITEYQNQEGILFDVQRWTAGRGAYYLDHVMEQVPIGAVVREPVERNRLYIVGRRLDPATQSPPPEVVFELRSPSAPDVFYAAESAPREWLAAVFDQARSRAGQTGEPKDSRSGACAGAFQAVSDAINADNHGAARVERFKATWSDLRQCLGRTSFDEYVAAVNRLIEADVLKTEGA